MKKIVTVILTVLTLCACVLPFTACGNDNKETKTYAIADYFTAVSGSIDEAIGTAEPTTFLVLQPKQTVKIKKITGKAWWIPSNHSAEYDLKYLDNEFTTTTFVNNFKIMKNYQSVNYFEMTPATCSSLKEKMTQNDRIRFETSNENINFSSLQITDLVIEFEPA